MNTTVSKPYKSRREYLDEIVAEAQKQIQAQNAEREAEHQAWLQSASPEEKMKIKRNALILEKRQTDAEHQRASHRLNVLLKETKKAAVQKWKSKLSIGNRNHASTDSIEQERVKWRAKWAADNRNYADPDSLEKERVEIVRHLAEINARIESEVNAEINAGETSCC